MTVPSEINRSGPYLGNGLTTVFSYQFRIVDQAHLNVILSDSNGIERTLALGADYSVSGVGNNNGGSITVTVPPAIGWSITILRSVPFIQNIDLENQGPYFAETVERAFDLSVMRDQELAEGLSRAIKVPVGTPNAGEVEAELAAGIVRVSQSADNIDLIAPHIDDVDVVAGEIDDVVNVSENIEIIKSASGSVLSFADQSYVAEDGQTDFTLPSRPRTQQDVIVWVNGVRQVPGDDYYVSDEILSLRDGVAEGGAVDVLVASAVSSEAITQMYEDFQSATQFNRQTIVTTAGVTLYSVDQAGAPIDVRLINHMLFGLVPFGLMTLGVDYVVENGAIRLLFEPGDGFGLQLMSLPRVSNSEAQAIVDEVLTAVELISEAPTSWADFARFAGYSDGKVVQFADGQLVRDRAANVTGLLAGPGWRPYQTQPSQFATSADYNVYLGAGNAEVAFKTALPTVARPVVHRARDSVSALDLMSSGGLDEAVRNREATSADAQAITDNLQEVVSSCASKQWRLDIPAGSFHLNAKLVAEKPIAIVGAGETATWLEWANGVPSAGIDISAGGVNRYSQVRDMSLFCNDAGASGMHTAIKMDYSSLISGGQIAPRGSKMVGVRNITARSTFGGVPIGWGRGVELVSVLAADVSDCRFNGVIVGASGSLPASAEGIFFHGSGSPVQLTVDRVYLSAFTDAVRTQDAEGIYISSSEFVNVRRGYRTSNTAPESGVVISSTHMNVLERAIDLQNMQDVILANNLFYAVEASTIPDAFIVVRDGCRNLDIHGNVCRRYTVPAPMDGIKLLGGQDIRIGHNTWFLHGQYSFERAIRIAAAATNVTVERQSYPHMIGAVPQIESASTSAEFAEWREYSGDLNDINTSRRMIEQNHTLAAGATNFPPGWSTPVGGVVQTYGRNDLDAVQVARNYQSNSGAAFTRRKMGGTWSPWA